MAFLELEALPCVAKWKSRVTADTWGVYKYIFREFVGFVEERGGVFAGMGPCGWVEWQGENYRDYDFVDLVQLWVGEKSGRHGYLVKCYGTISSFFRHNRVYLPPDPDFKVRGDRPSVVGSFPVEEYRRLLLSFNPLYRAVGLCLSMGLMGVGELVYWSDHGWDSLCDQLDSRDRFIRVDLPGRKRYRFIKPYFTLLGRDAVDAVRVYVDTVRPDEGDSVFLTQHNTALRYKTLSTYWMDHLKRLGLVEPSHSKRRRTGKNPHELRDMGRTRFQFSDADPLVAEFIMGHIVDTNQYNKAMQNEDYVRLEYRKAEPWLNVLSEDPERISVSEHLRKVEEYDDLKQRIEELEEIKRFYEIDRRIEERKKR